MKPICYKDKGNICVKQFFDKELFNDECKIYGLLKNKYYVPKIIEIQNMKIVMEDLGDNSLNKYLLHHHIPKSLGRQLYGIAMDMLELDLYSSEHGIGNKFEHIFIDESKNEDEKGYIRIVDFDHVDTINNNSRKVFEEDLKREYDYLFNKNSKKLEELKNIFRLNGVDDDKIEDFLKQYREL